MGDQHPDAKPAAKGSIEKGRHCLLVGDVLPAVTEPLRQGCHHVLVVLHQSSGGRGSGLEHYFAKPFSHRLLKNKDFSETCSSRVCGVWGVGAFLTVKSRAQVLIMMIDNHQQNISR